jgi:hypothetical protein
VGRWLLVLMVLVPVVDDGLCTHPVLGKYEPHYSCHCVKNTIASQTLPQSSCSKEQCVTTVVKRVLTTIARGG